MIETACKGIFISYVGSFSMQSIANNRVTYAYTHKVPFVTKSLRKYTLQREALWAKSAICKLKETVHLRKIEDYAMHIARAKL